MPAPRFLVDENLSVVLPEVAHRRGFQATHVNHVGLGAATDWRLLRFAIENDYALVTNNAVEFHGRYAREALHPGIVLLLPTVRRIQQIELFEALLDDVRGDPDLVNKAIILDYEDDHLVTRRYDLSAPQ